MKRIATIHSDKPHMTTRVEIYREFDKKPTAGTSAYVETCVIYGGLDSERINIKMTFSPEPVSSI